MYSTDVCQCYPLTSNCIFITIVFGCYTCLLCDMYVDLGRWRGCIECGQSIVCLRLFRGHACVCPSCWPE